MTDEPSIAGPNPATTVARVVFGVLATETLALAVMLPFVGLAVVLLGAAALFAVWVAASTRSRATVAAIGVVAFIFLPFIAVVLTAGALGRANL